MTTADQPAGAQPAQAVAPTKGDLVIKMKNSIQQMAAEFQRSLPPSIPAEKFVRTIQTAIQMNPDIAMCDRTSVMNSCMKAAADGLILDGREAALVIYISNKGTKENPKWVKSAQYIPMVTGIIKRVRNSGEVSRFNAFVVHANDVFKVRLGLEPSLEHEPNYMNPGAIIGAYAICRFKDGLDDFEFMSVAQIESIRARSKSKDSGPWKTDYEEMCKKTAMRRLSKRLPMDSDLRNVVQRVDELFDETEPNPGTVDADTGEVEEVVRAPARKKRGAGAAKVAQAEQGQTADAPQQPKQETASKNVSNAAAAQGQAGTVQDAQFEDVADQHGERQQDDSEIDDII